MVLPPATGSIAPPDERQPTRRQAALFLGKTWGLRLARLGRETIRGRPLRFRQEAAISDSPLLAESRARLYPSDASAEFALQVGKAQNLRLAAARLQGLTVPPGGVFSFWRHVPRPTRRRGFAAGRELREGCVIPSVGGGLCQLSNALYDAALTAGFEIVERHAHSRRLPGSMAEVGRDATVFWNYVDLRFRPPEGCRIEAFFTRTELIVRFRALQRLATPPVILPTRQSAQEQPPGEPAVESCETCGVLTCFRHPPTTDTARLGQTAWLVDAWWPEFDLYLQKTHAPGDTLLLPLDGTRFGLRSYRWNTRGFGRIGQAPRETLWRAWRSRRLASQGAVRQRALLAFDEALAARYAAAIPPAATHLVVSQNLLPFLWRMGTLGGRTFDVLMTRLPMLRLQRTLDRAAACHPESRTLPDFRADPGLAEAEDAALAEASHWITPHGGIAALAAKQSIRLPWQLPAAPAPVLVSPSPTVPSLYFPASTLGRKGAYELRAAVRELGWHVRLGGPVLEDEKFWHGIPTSAAGPDGFLGTLAVVLPAWIEHQPRRLLAAVAAGIPVIASEACGLDGVPGVQMVPTGDIDALTEFLRSPLPQACSSFSNGGTGGTVNLPVRGGTGS